MEIFVMDGTSFGSRARELNEATMRYAPLGFRPVHLGSNLLWLDMEQASFWV